jgi:hypothetical protein
MASATKETYNNHISLLFFSQLNTGTGSTIQTLSYYSLIKNCACWEEGMREVVKE